MHLLLKVGDKYPKGHPNHELGWRDGQIIEIREEGAFDSAKSSRRSFCVINVKGDFWIERGSTDWKTTNPKAMEMKKLMSSSDSNGKYRWEAGYLEDEDDLRKRDFFIDYKDLLDTGKISENAFNSIYDSSKNHDEIDLSLDKIDDLKKDEKVDTRKKSTFNP
jgi:hypothetical protein